MTWNFLDPFRKLVRHRMAVDTFGYTSAIILSRIPAFIFLPIFAAVLGPEKLGRYLTAIILADLIQTLSGMGMVQALFRFFPQAKNLEGRKAMLGTALLTVIACGALIWLLFLVGFLWPTIRDKLEAFRGLTLPLFLLSLTAGTLISIISILNVYIWAEKKPWAFFIALAAGAVLEAGVSIFMLAAHKVSLERILAIECIKDGVVILVLAWIARFDLSLRFSPSAFNTLFRFGVWLMPMGLFSWMFLSIDRFWLGQMTGLTEVGIYGFFYKFASPAAILFQSYIISMDSHLFKSEGEQGRALVTQSLSRYLKLGGYLLVVAGVVFPLGIYVSSHVWKALPPVYLQGLKVYPLLLASTYVYFWALHYAAMLEFELRSKRQLVFMSVVAFGNFALCPVFIAVGRAIGLDPMSSVAISNLASAAGFLALQSGSSSLAPARLLWRNFLPALLSLVIIFLTWSRFF